MSHCDECGAPENMPYQCNHCGGTFCSSHRLPESHDCPGLENWNDPGGVFDSGFDDSVVTESNASVRSDLRDRLTGPGSVMGYFRGNMTYVFLGLMWITFLLQHLALLAGGRSLHRALFVLHPAQVGFVWTWVTSIFAHAPGSFLHIAGNSIVIFFFGRIVEQYLGTRKFTALFLVSGALAGLSQIALNAFQGVPVGVLGASGAGLAIMAFLSVLNPDLRVYLWFLIPVPIWVITIGYFALSVGGILGTGPSVLTGNVANMGHLTGLVIGIVYGVRMKGRRRVPQHLQLGGGRGPGGRRGPGGPGRGGF